ncbi:MAG: hypothetical protein JWR80_9329 [Bradyrhizobium sp.]|nr:hypothetical protein [Bradyrhizobium sp.]
MYVLTIAYVVAYREIPPGPCPGEDAEVGGEKLAVSLVSTLFWRRLIGLFPLCLTLQQRVRVMPYDAVRNDQGLSPWPGSGTVTRPIGRVLALVRPLACLWCIDRTSDGAGFLMDRPA